jgi:hypothetical protein
MSPPMTTYRNVVAGLAVAMILLGLAMFAETVRRGGGVGLIIGVLFVGAGAGRLWMLRGHR